MKALETIFWVIPIAIIFFVGFAVGVSITIAFFRNWIKDDKDFEGI